MLLTVLSVVEIERIVVFVGVSVDADDTDDFRVVDDLLNVVWA